VRVPLPRRRQRAADLDFGPTTIEQMLARLEPYRPLTSGGPVYVRGSADRLAVRLPGGQLAAPPVLTGQLQQHGASVRLVGTIRETRTSLAMPLLYAGLAVAMALLGLAIAPFGGLLPALIICLPAALAFGMLAATQFRTRRESFEIEADDVEQQLRNVLRA
jgi:hypothetical protein